MHVFAGIIGISNAAFFLGIRALLAWFLVSAITLHAKETTDPAEIWDDILLSYNPHHFTDDPSGNAVGWGTGTLLMAYLSRFEATRDPYYLSLIKENAQLVFANRSDRLGLIDTSRNQVVPAWVSTRYSDDIPFAWLVHAGNFMYPVARWTYLVRSDDALWEEFGWYAERFIDEITQVIDFFELVDWREGPSPNEGFFTGHFATNLQEQPLPFNMMHTIGRTYVAMYLATGEVRFRDKAERMAFYWYNRLEMVEDRFVWNYANYNNRSNWIEDISHGGISVDFALQCYRAGILFSGEDMIRFARTFEAMRHPGQGYYWRVDGSGDNSGSHTAHGWLRLGWFVEDILYHYQNWLTANWQDPAPLLMLNASATLEEVLIGDLTMEQPAPTRPPAIRPRCSSLGFVATFQGDRLFNDENPSSSQWFSRGIPAGNVNAVHYVQDNRLHISDVATRAVGNFTADATFRRKVGNHSGDFLAVFHFGWDMQNPTEPSLVGHRKAMPRILFRLLGDSGESLAEVGLQDRVYSGSKEAFGNLVAGLAADTNNFDYSFSNENHQVIGEAKFRLYRNDGVLRIFLEDDPVPVFETEMDQTVVAVEMVFGQRFINSLSDAFFGRAWVEAASIYPTLEFPENTLWRLESFPEGLTTGNMQVDENVLEVNDIRAEAAGNFDAVLTLTRPVEIGQQDFESEFVFHWDMYNSQEPDLIGHRKAVPTVLMRLLDERETAVIEAGLEDRIYSGNTAALGKRVIRVGAEDANAGWDTIFEDINPLVADEMHVRIVSRDQILRVYVRGYNEPILELPHYYNISAIQLHLSRRVFAALPDAFFGTFHIKNAGITPPGTRFTWWREIHFPPDTSFDDSISGPNATFRNTGIPNLLAYAFTPWSETPSGMPSYPQPASISLNGSSHFGLHVPIAQKPDLDYHLEASIDLKNWYKVTSPLVVKEALNSWGIYLPEGTFDNSHNPQVFLRLAIAPSEVP